MKHSTLHAMKELKFIGEILRNKFTKMKTDFDAIEDGMEEYEKLLSKLFLLTGACCEEEDCKCEE